mmetsp:Transcript_4912/g.17532  ORF Transcript_4912/g.17532 Transcript_4912/m.17532 type:complete len:276 (+) Transcript_4912:4715-5542(+)
MAEPAISIPSAEYWLVSKEVIVRVGLLKVLVFHEKDTSPPEEMEVVLMEDRVVSVPSKMTTLPPGVVLVKVTDSEPMMVRSSKKTFTSPPASKEVSAEVTVAGTGPTTFPKKSISSTALKLDSPSPSVLVLAKVTAPFPIESMLRSVSSLYIMNIADSAAVTLRSPPAENSAVSESNWLTSSSSSELRRMKKSFEVLNVTDPAWLTSKSASNMEMSPLLELIVPEEPFSMRISPTESSMLDPERVASAPRLVMLMVSEETWYWRAMLSVWLPPEV